MAFKLVALLAVLAVVGAASVQGRAKLGDWGRAWYSPYDLDEPVKCVLTPKGAQCFAETELSEDVIQADSEAADDSSTKYAPRPGSRTEGRCIIEAATEGRTVEGRYEYNLESPAGKTQTVVSPARKGVLRSDIKARGLEVAANKGLDYSAVRAQWFEAALNKGLDRSDIRQLLDGRSKSDEPTAKCFERSVEGRCRGLDAEGRCPEPAAEDRAPVEPAAEGRTPFEPAAEGRTPFEPATQGRTPFRPATQGRTPFEPAAQGRAPLRPAAEGRTPFEPAAEGRAPLEAATQGRTPFRPAAQGRTPSEPAAQGRAPLRPATQGRTPFEPASQGRAPLEPATEARSVAGRSKDQLESPAFRMQTVASPAEKDVLRSDIKDRLIQAAANEDYDYTAVRSQIGLERSELTKYFDGRCKSDDPTSKCFEPKDEHPRILV